MSFGSRMKERFRIATRTEASDTWATQGDWFRAQFAPLSASGARRESTLLEPDVTHIMRIRPGPPVEAGQRLQRERDKAEFAVRAVRDEAFGSSGQIVILVAQVAKAL